MEKEMTFEQMVEAYSPTITKICFFYAETADEVADLRQDTFINLWRGWEGFRADANLSTWIHRVCLNTCVSYIRRESRHRNKAPLPEIVDDTTDADRTELWLEIRRQINTLSKRERAVIILWLEEFSYDDIAEVTGLSRSAVATLLHRIKQKLIKLNAPR